MCSCSYKDWSTCSQEHIMSYGQRLIVNLTFVYPCIVSIIVNDDQQDATTLAYLFVPNHLYMFRAMSSPIIRST